MKKGLDYFSLPCVEDEKIELIEAELGLEGFAVIVKLLGKIYGQNGYYCQWDSDCAMLFARKSCISYDFVNKVVDVAIKRGFFCHALFEKYGILTSSEIQQFFLNAAKRRKEVVLDSRFICVNESISDTRSCNTSETAEKAAMEVTAEKAVCKAIDADGFSVRKRFWVSLSPRSLTLKRRFLAVRLTSMRSPRKRTMPQIRVVTSRRTVIKAAILNEKATHLKKRRHTAGMGTLY